MSNKSINILVVLLSLVFCNSAIAGVNYYSDRTFTQFFVTSNISNLKIKQIVFFADYVDQNSQYISCNKIKEDVTFLCKSNIPMLSARMCIVLEYHSVPESEPLSKTIFYIYSKSSKFEDTAQSPFSIGSNSGSYIFNLQNKKSGDSWVGQLFISDAQNPHKIDKKAIPIHPGLSVFAIKSDPQLKILSVSDIDAARYPDNTHSFHCLYSNDVLGWSCVKKSLYSIKPYLSIRFKDRSGSTHICTFLVSFINNGVEGSPCFKYSSSDTENVVKGYGVYRDISSSYSDSLSLNYSISPESRVALSPKYYSDSPFKQFKIYDGVRRQESSGEDLELQNVEFYPYYTNRVGANGAMFCESDFDKSESKHFFLCKTTHDMFAAAIILRVGNYTRISTNYVYCIYSTNFEEQNHRMYTCLNNKYILSSDSNLPTGFNNLILRLSQHGQQHHVLVYSFKVVPDLTRLPGLVISKVSPFSLDDNLFCDQENNIWTCQINFVKNKQPLLKLDFKIDNTEYSCIISIGYSSFGIHGSPCLVMDKYSGIKPSDYHYGLYQIDAHTLGLTHTIAPHPSYQDPSTSSSSSSSSSHQ